ncbi:methyl-accepting chemotaxis protein [Brevibacillus porteri]|uniref:methyl-accepting chemotaxis protein n=1 Tax=Brevibacillus porteri TaxID=2126350 RepID=UPI003642C606
MKMKTKLILVIGIFISILTSLQVFTSTTSNQIRSSYQEILDESQLQYLWERVQFRAMSMFDAERVYLLKGNEDSKKEIEELTRLIIADLDSITNMHKRSEDIEKVNKIKSLFADRAHSSAQVREAYQSRRYAEANHLHTSSEQKVSNELNSIVNDLLKKGEKALADKRESLEAYAILIGMISWTITGVAVLFGLIVGVLLYRSIVKPIQLINIQLKEIADGEGDLTKELQVKTNDDIGETVKSFNRMLTNLRELIMQVRSNAEHVAQSSEEVTASAGQIRKASEQISGTIQEVADITEQQVQSVESSTRTIHHLSVSIQQIAANAESVSATALHAANIASTGSKGIHRAVSQGSTVTHAINNVTNMVKGLGVRSHEIDQIMEVISGIASQTQLLALNAAIEAAHAGENGRGFAVVAGEVRILAEQASQSSQQISHLIHSIQEETRKAVQQMEMSREEVLQATGIVKAAGDIFTEIQHAVKDVAANIHEVSLASQQMKEGTINVVNEVDQISGAAVRTATGTQEVAAASEEQLASMEEISTSTASLSRMAEELESLINRFKV